MAKTNSEMPERGSDKLFEKEFESNLERFGNLSIEELTEKLNSTVGEYLESRALDTLLDKKCRESWGGLSLEEIEKMQEEVSAEEKGLAKNVKLNILIDLRMEKVTEAPEQKVEKTKKEEILEEKILPLDKGNEKKKSVTPEQEYGNLSIKDMEKKFNLTIDPKDSRPPDELLKLFYKKCRETWQNLSLKEIRKKQEELQGKMRLVKQEFGKWEKSIPSGYNVEMNVLVELAVEKQGQNIPETPPEAEKNRETSEKPPRLEAELKERGILGKILEDLKELEETIEKEFPELSKKELKSDPRYRGKIGEMFARIDRMNDLLQGKFPETFIKFVLPLGESGRGVIGGLEREVKYIDGFLKSIEEMGKKEETKIEQPISDSQPQKRNIFKKISNFWKRGS